MAETGALMPDDLRKQARDHAWEWFCLHSSQRMQTFNYFLISTAFLVAAYGTLLKENPAAAAVVAIVGAWLAYWFRRLDMRTRQLIHAARKPLLVLQGELARRLEIPELEIVQGVEDCRPGSSTYGRVIDVTHFTVAVLFLAAAVYAGATVAFKSPLRSPPAAERTVPHSNAYASFRFFSGRLRTGLPVAAWIALSTAGATTQMVGSPTPPQKS